MLTSINPAALSAGGSLIVLGLALAFITRRLWCGTRPFAGHNAAPANADSASGRGAAFRRAIACAIIISAATAAAALIAAGIATAWPLA